MITVKQIVAGLQASELREHVFGTNALTDLGKLNSIIILINQAVEELNKDLMLSRTTYPLVYDPSHDVYCVDVCNLERIIGVYDKYGNDFSFDSSAVLQYEPRKMNTVGNNENPLIVYTETFSTLRFPYKYAPQTFNVICRTAMCPIEYAFTVEEGLVSALDLPQACLQAIIAFVAHKIAKPISPSREGNLNAGNDQLILYDAAVKKLKDQGYGYTLAFSTDRLFANSTFK